MKLEDQTFYLDVASLIRSNALGSREVMQAEMGAAPIAMSELYAMDLGGPKAKFSTYIIRTAVRTRK